MINRVTFDLLSAMEHQPPPLTEISICLGPKETISAQTYHWWEMTGIKPSGEQFAVRLLSEHVPMTRHEAPGLIKRYILREHDNCPIEYIDLRTGGPLLPKFDFVGQLLPQVSPFTRWESKYATTGTCLGHVLSLAKLDTSQWTEWPSPLRIELNPDETHYMYGLARDTEGQYLSEGDYTYVPLERYEIEELVSLGLNCLMVDDRVEAWIQQLPVFYYKQFTEGSSVDYPNILYRSTFQGSVPFIDEPEIHILKDEEDLAKIKRPEEGAFLLTKRLQEIWENPMPNEWRRGLLRERLLSQGINLGTLKLDDADHPIWVTMLETSFYQLQGGSAGIVHEGRYRIEEFVRDFKRFIDEDITVTPRELLLINYAWLRGAARAWHKSWGMAIYGQCDPEIAPLAVTLAYDMGARYIWFWTYDHQHHLPHFMKLNLLKHLKEHKARCPRQSLKALLFSAGTVIALPYGYGYCLGFDQMWESPNLNIAELNAAGVPHRVVFASALKEAIKCVKRGEDFDFAVDIGQAFEGYNRVVRIGLDGSVKEETC
ncbi:MAG: hypothetical protein K6U00_04075 [Armatimonadetes bacterium]|nr:hypothetical protein [Armatimonadota bacterium]